MTSFPRASITEAAPPALVRMRRIAVGLLVAMAIRRIRTSAGGAASVVLARGNGVMRETIPERGGSSSGLGDWGR